MALMTTVSLPTTTTGLSHEEEYQCGTQTGLSSFFFTTNIISLMVSKNLHGSSFSAVEAAARGDAADDKATQQVDSRAVTLVETATNPVETE